MSNQEILTKAITQAIAGGWITNLLVYPYEVESNFVTIHYLEEDADMHAYEIIFNRGFAKALWGDKPIIEKPPIEIRVSKWQYHLQQMVVAEDPIAYLGANI